MKLTQKGENVWRGDLAEGWDIVGKTNGGYMQAIAAKASGLAVGGRVPVSVTGHFARPGETGPIVVDTEVIRAGRRFSIVRSRISQHGETILETVGTFQELQADPPDVLLADVDPPDIPPPNECIRAVPASDNSFPPPLVGELDIRIEPEAAGALMGKPSGKALMQGWFRLKDGEEADPYAFILAADAFPPTTFPAALPLGWTPTLELTVHVRDAQPKGWLKCSFSSHFVTGGFIEEDGLIWDEDNRLVAQSRQLALVSQVVSGSG